MVAVAGAGWAEAEIEGGWARDSSGGVERWARRLRLSRSLRCVAG